MSVLEKQGILNKTALFENCVQCLKVTQINHKIPFIKKLEILDPLDYEEIIK